MRSLSPRAQRLVSALSQDEGREQKASQIHIEHVLLALIKSADGLGYCLLHDLLKDGKAMLSLQVALEKGCIQNKAALRPFSPRTSLTQDLNLSRRLKALLDVADMEAAALGNEYVGTEHIVLAAIREEGSAVQNFFSAQGITIDDARRQTSAVQSHHQTSSNDEAARSLARSVFQNLMGGSLFAAAGGGVPTPPPNERAAGAAGKKKKGESYLAQYSRDITQAAREGSVDPVVGRDKEISRVIAVLSRRTKNNPVLIGEPGVGKTAIVEGLALRMASNNVPRGLVGRRILSLDLAAVIAGTKYRGEFEERMKRIMKELVNDKSIILFIDELHTLIGAGGAEGTMDASNMIKPAMSRGEMQVIGATTTREYTRYIEKDAALARRFQKVVVVEPTDDETVEILDGIKQKYEEYHGVVFDKGVIPTIVRFSRRYIPERALPDKAIDIMDEVGAAKKIESDERPAEIETLEKAIADLSVRKQEAVEKQDYEAAAEVRDKVAEMRRALTVYAEYWKNNGGAGRRHVEVSDVAHVVSEMTGIKAEDATSDDKAEAKRLLHMEEELHKSVIGQDDALKAIAGAVRRGRVGVSSPKHPIGSFMFLGPTGVGKTQVAKALASFLFGSEEDLIRIDMSDYMEKHNASRLVGSPPGYVGYEEGGVLTEAVREHPYSVVLLDEVEKAHPDVMNLLLQMLEEGELKDNLGHTVNFRNTVVIMTSNAGSRQITTNGRAGFSFTESGVLPYSELRASALAELKKTISPELLNRIDDVVVFRALDKEEIGSILDIQLNELSLRLSLKHISLDVRPKAREYLVQKGYDAEMGARPMRRLIQREVEEKIALSILSDMGSADSGSVIVDSDGKEIAVHLARIKGVMALDNTEAGEMVESGKTSE